MRGDGSSPKSFEVCMISRSGVMCTYTWCSMLEAGVFGWDLLETKSSPWCNRELSPWMLDSMTLVGVVLSCVAWLAERGFTTSLVGK